MTLSDKIVMNDYDIRLLSVKNVKQFIKDLKTYLNVIPKEEEIGLTYIRYKILKYIDKLVGEELI